MPTALAAAKIQSMGSEPWIYRRTMLLLSILGIPAVAALILTCLLIFQASGGQGTARLTAADRHLTGTVESTLAAKIAYDAANSQYVFNAADKKSPAVPSAPPGSDAYKKRVGLYSVDLPVDPSKGFTYYNNDLGLSFTIVPRFPMGRAQLIGGHVVYPLPDGGQAVYSVKGNGLEEDIILHSPVSAATYKYQLRLPDTLQAKRIPNSGSIGIYSADPRLFEHISYSTPSDQQKVESARKNSSKTNLAFALPAPVIKQNNPGPHNGTGNVRFAMSGNRVSVIGEGLRNLSYPISLDPSVVINTTAGFEAGNNEGNIDFGTNQIKRGGLTGGALGTWTTLSSTPLPTNLRLSGAVVADGYVYEIGGDTGAGSTANVYYAQLNSGGTLGAWNTATNPLPQVNQDAVAVAYNGYLYEIGGCAPSCAGNYVYYSKIGTGGAPGAWTQSPHNLNTATAFASAAAYDGYIYVVGGCTGSTCSTPLNSTEFTPVNADGSIGAWTTSATTLPAATEESASVASNGYLYEIGGFTTAAVSAVYYTALKSNGDINAWTSSSALPAATYDAAAVANDGYVYLLGNNAAATVYYASFNANGSLSSWATNSNALPSSTFQEGAVAWAGYVFVLGGCIAACPGNTVVSAPVQAPGYIDTWTSTTALSQATYYATSVAYNGYVYEIGGYSSAKGGKTTPNVYYATLNSDGTLGAWNSTTALPTGTQQATSVAYNGYLYEIGGCQSSCSTATVDYAPINSNGTLGSWTATTSLPAATYEATSVAYNGYLYEIGGYTTAASAVVDYAPINSNGTIGSWLPTTSLPVATLQATSVVYDGYVYEIGGAFTTTVDYAPINSDGTIGTWNPTTALPVARGSATSVVYNGYLYELGGNDGANPSSVVYFASIQSDGSLGAWGATANMPVISQQATSVIYNGYVYEIGGCPSICTAVATVYFGAINNGGSPAAGSWTATSSLLATRVEANAVVYNGYVYELGGMNSISGAPQNTVYYAQVNADGSLAAWNTTTPLQVAVCEATAVVYNGYIYEMGGDTSQCGIISATCSVYYAKINSDGTLGAWVSTSALPSSIALCYQASATTYNGRIYVLGGSTTEYVAINADGTLGTWAATTSMPASTSESTTVAYNGYLYEIGGTVSNGIGDTVVYFAAINADGTVGAWNVTTSLPVASDGAAAVVSGGRVYVIGGAGSSCSGSASSATVEYASIGAGGGLGPWIATTSLPAGVCESSSVTYNGYLYQIGGYTTVAVATVNYTPFANIPRIAHYSKLIDLGVTNATLNTIGYTGTLPNGLAAIGYTTAGSTGTFSAQGLASTLTGSNGASNIEYVWVFLTLDDSQASGGYPDSLSTTNSNVTSITINYTVPCTHAAPGVRLRGGKSFSSGAQTPLDTCFP